MTLHNNPSPGSQGRNNVDPAWDSAPFRNWLHEQMRQLEWTQTDLAKALNAPQSTVGRWLRGQQPSTYYADLLGDVLGADVDTVLSLTGHRPQRPEPGSPGDEQRQRILNLVRRIDLGINDRGDFLETNLRRWLAADLERQREGQ